MLAAGPKPTPKPTVTPTKAPTADPTATTGDPFSIWGWLLHHPIAIPIIIIATWIAVLYGWSELRKYYLTKGKPVAPLGSIIRRVWRFMFKEDKRPVLAKIKPLADKTTWLTGTRLYLILLALIPISATTHIFPWPVAVFAFIVTLTARARPIFRQRWGVQMQMFAVAAAECRYPKGAELNPWGYVNIQDWRNLTQPGNTIITYPPAFQSEDRNVRDKFERNFNGTVSEENTWNYTWESAKNRVICKPTDFLPTMANYPGPGPKWNEFVLGTTGEGQAIWDVSSFPHALVCGPTGSGKSVLQRMILFHALAHSDTWRIVGVDPKMVEMGWLKKYDNVIKIALTLEEGVEVVQSVRDEMMRRYDEMSELGYNHFQNLPQPPPALLCMVDETFNFLALEGIKSEEGKERDAMHAQASTLLGEIARLGRAAGVHLVLATQRPDASVLKGELKNNLDCRIAAGRMDTTPSLMVLDSEHATRLPKIKGRGVIRLGGEIETFQGYFAPQEWYDQWKAEQEAGLPVPGDVMGEIPGGPESEPDGKKGRFGLTGLAAKAAAKAEERSKSLDADAAPASEYDDLDDLGERVGDLELDLDDMPALEQQAGTPDGPAADVTTAWDTGEPDEPVHADAPTVAQAPAAEVPTPAAPTPAAPPRIPPSAPASRPRATRPAGPPPAHAPAPPPAPTPQPMGPPPPPPSAIPSGTPRPVVSPPTARPGGPQFVPPGVNPLTGQPIRPATSAGGGTEGVLQDETSQPPTRPRLPNQPPTGLPVQRPAGLPTRPPTTQA